MDRFVQFEQQMRWSKLNEVLRSIDDDIMVKIMLWCSQQSQAFCFHQFLNEIIWTASVNDLNEKDRRNHLFKETLRKIHFRARDSKQA